MVPPKLFVVGAMLAAALALAGSIYATSTVHWITLSRSDGAVQNDGLFQLCVTVGGYSACSSDSPVIGICGYHTEGQKSDRTAAQRACAILAIILGAASLVSLIALQFCGGKKLPGVIGIVLALLAFVSMGSTFALYAYLHNTWYFCGESYCNAIMSQTFAGGLTFTSCGYGYSFTVAVLSSIMWGVSGILQGIALCNNGNTESRNVQFTAVI